MPVLHKLRPKAVMEGLKKSDVMDLQHTSSLLPAAWLLIAIWSYHRKCLANRDVLKYKSRVLPVRRNKRWGETTGRIPAPQMSWATTQMMMILFSC